MQMIIAGNAKQAWDAAQSKRLGSDWFNIIDAEDLRGLRPGSTVWLVGTYYERRDYDELAELCAARDIGLVRV